MHRIKTNWDKIVLIALLGIVGIITAYFLLPLSHWQKVALEILDIIFLSILAIDVIYKFKKAHDKIRFIKKNWIEIIVLLPIGFLSELIRLTEFLELFRVYRFAQLSVHAQELFAIVPLSFLGAVLHRKKPKKPRKRK